jgi:diacylglycerol kinase (ATP)
MKLLPVMKRRMRAKLIFNSSAGASRATPIKIEDVIHEMQAWKLVPEAYLVEPGEGDLAGVIQAALAQGIRMFVVCGGDGTISAVARTLAGTPATLGIIPVGTRNNTALSLGIPEDVQAAIAILRTGRRTRVDVGTATCGKTITPFLEICSVGLVSTLFPSFDDIQHGNLAKIGEFLSTLSASPPAKIHLLLDDKKEIHDLGHVVLVSNMPYIGAHYQVGSAASFRDGLLDVLFFADLSKLDLLSWVFQGVGPGKPEDSRIQHFHVRRVDIDTHPGMAVMADGIALGEGRVRIEVKRRVLNVMVPLSRRAVLKNRPKPSSTRRKKPRALKAFALETWARFSTWVRRHGPISRMAGMTVVLVLLFLFLPAYMRIGLWHGLQSHTILAIMLVVFSLLAVSLVWSTGQRLDAWAFLVLNVRGRRPIWMDQMMLGLAYIGGSIAALGLALVLFLTSDHLLAYEIGLGTVTLWLVVEILKFLAHRSRPFVRLTEARVVGYRPFGRSFPSGHASQAFFMATLMAQHFHSIAWVVCLLYPAALMVAITRIYVGAHYPRDVLAGAILGSAWGILGAIVDGYVLARIG